MFLTAMFAVVMMTGCARQVVQPSTMDPGFDTHRWYRVAVMPFFVHGLTTPGAFERDTAYQYLINLLSGTGKFMPFGQAEVEQAVRAHESGQQSGVDSVMARQIGKELGADLVCITELTFDRVAPKVTLNASVRIVRPDKPTDMYHGFGKATDVPMAGAAAEQALDMATYLLVSRVK